MKAESLRSAYGDAWAEWSHSGEGAAWDATTSDGAMAEAWVYVLRCRDGSLYTGWTNDLDRRLGRHAEGKASRYTASRLPVELAAAWPLPDRGAAMREEARIKRLPRAAKLELVAQAPVAAG